MVPVKNMRYGGNLFMARMCSVYFQARKTLCVEKAVYFPGPDLPELSQALDILNNQLFLAEKMKIFICFGI